MEVIIEKVDIFKQIINYVSEIGTETIFKFTEEGLSIIIGDSVQATTLMSKILLKPDFFSTYNIEGATSIGLFLSDFKAGLRSGSTITLRENENKFQIISGNTVYNAPILNDVSTLDRIPNIDYQTQPLTLEMNCLKDAILATNAIKDDKVVFKTEEGVLEVSCQESIRNVKTSVTQCTDDINTGFSKKSIGKIINAPNSTITLQLQNELPITIKQDTEDFELIFILAVRI